MSVEVQVPSSAAVDTQGKKELFIIAIKGWRFQLPTKPGTTWLGRIRVPSTALHRSAPAAQRRVACLITTVESLYIHKASQTPSQHGVVMKAQASY